jgi:hypothetical protein
MITVSLWNLNSDKVNPYAHITVETLWEAIRLIGGANGEEALVAWDRDIHTDISEAINITAGVWQADYAPWQVPSGVIVCHFDQFFIRFIYTNTSWTHELVIRPVDELTAQNLCSR